MGHKTLGTVLGLGVILALLAGGFYWLALPLLVSPARPEFENEFPITGPTPTPVADSASPTPSPNPSPTATPTSADNPDQKIGTVIEPLGLSVRAEPNRSSATLTGIALNETVEILETSSDGEFYRIKTRDGSEGWVIANLIEVSPSASQD